MKRITLHDIFSISETDEPDVFIFDIDITDESQERQRMNYCVRPEDPYGFAPFLRQWKKDNPSFPISPASSSDNAE